MLKDCFSTRDVLELTGVTARQLQWWDEQRIVVPARDGRNRVYSEADLLDILVIEQLGVRSISLARVRRVLRLLACGTACAPRRSCLGESRTPSFTRRKTDVSPNGLKTGYRAIAKHNAADALDKSYGRSEATARRAEEFIAEVGGEETSRSNQEDSETTRDSIARRQIRGIAIWTPQLHIARQTARAKTREV